MLLFIYANTVEIQALQLGSNELIDGSPAMLLVLCVEVEVVVVNLLPALPLLQVLRGVVYELPHALGEELLVCLILPQQIQYQKVVGIIVGE
jgi:hypothetical protein